MVKSIVGVLITVLTMLSSAGLAQAAFRLDALQSPGAVQISLRPAKGDPDVKLAEFDLALSNPTLETGDLELVHVSMETGAAARLVKRPMRFTEGRLTLFATASTLRLEPGASGLVRVGIALGKGADPSLADGVITATLHRRPSVPPATVRVSVAGAEEGAPAMLEPTEVTLTVTRSRPSWQGPLTLAGVTGGTANVWLRNLSSRQGLNLTGRLSGDRGGSMPVEIQLGEPSTAGQAYPGTLRVVEVPRAGAFSGSLNLKPGEEDAPVLKVTVNTQDHWGYPLGTLAAGVVLAALVRWLRDQKRPKDLLKASIKDAGSSYWRDRELTGVPVPAGPVYLLDKVFPKPEEGYRDVQTAPKGKPELKEAEQTFHQVSQAKSSASLEAVQAEVRELQSRAALWKPSVLAAETLEKTRGSTETELKGLEADPAKFYTLAYASELVKNRSKPPTTAAEATKLRDELLAQPQALALSVEAWQLAREARLLFAALKGIQLTPLDRAALRDSDPDAIVQNYLYPSKTPADLERYQVMRRLREALRTLQGLVSVYPQPSISKGREADNGAGRGRGAGFTRQSAEVAGMPAVIPTVLPPFVPVDKRAAPQILASVRFRDWLDFFFAAVAVSLTFFLTLYVGKNFGNPEEYLTALLAGSAGTLLIDWTLQPWFRNYQTSTKAKPE